MVNLLLFKVLFFSFYVIDSQVQYPTSLRNPTHFQSYQNPDQNQQKPSNQIADILEQNSKGQRNMNNQQRSYAYDDQQYNANRNPPVPRNRSAFNGQGSSIENNSHFQNNLNKFFAVGEPPAPINQKRNYQTPQNQQSSYQMLNDPKFQNSVNKFFAVGEPPAPVNQNRTPQRGYSQNQQMNNRNMQTNQQMIPNDPKFQNSLNKFFAVGEPPAPVNQNRNLQRNIPTNQPQQNLQDPQFQNNLNKFFAVGEPPAPMSQNRNYQKASSQNNQMVPNDPKFEHNLNKFFAVGEPPAPVNQYRNNIRPSQQQISSQQMIPNDPKFQNSLNKFFAVGEPPAYPASRSNQGQNQQQGYQNYQPQGQQYGGQQQQFQGQYQQYQGQQQQQQQQFSGQQQQQSWQGGQNGAQLSAKQGIQGRQKSNQTKTLALADSSSAVRNLVFSFFRTRGIDDFDVFSCPGGALACNNNPVWQQSLQGYITFMQGSYDIKELFIISTLDSNSNSKIFIQQANDRNAHASALENVRNFLIKQLNVPFKVSGIIIDQRGASEKIF